MSLERRMSRIEYETFMRDCAKAAATTTNVTPAMLLAEAHRVFALPDAEQRDYFANIYRELDAKGEAEMDALRHRWATILRGAR
jgi:hypothetical protein